MFSLYDLLILFGVGSAGGVLAGLLGIGGGLVYVIAFSYFLQRYDLGDIELVKFILSNAIFAVFFAGLSATIKQIFNRNFYFREVIITALPGVVGALLVSFLILQFDWYSRDKFSIIVIVLLGILGLRMFKPAKQVPGSISRDDLPASSYLISGFFSGTLSALSGLGGGIILIPVLSGFMRLNIRMASSISLGIMPFYTLAMSIFYGMAHGSPDVNIPFTMGYIILPMAVPLALGVITFAPLGVFLAQKLPQPVIRLLFAIVIVFVMVEMIFEHFLKG